VQFIVRLVLAAASSIAALFVARDSPNFEVVAGMIGVAVIAGVVLATVIATRRRDGG
jgi:hypothetical protein